MHIFLVSINQELIEDGDYCFLEDNAQKVKLLVVVFGKFDFDELKGKLGNGQDYLLESLLFVLKNLFL